MLSPVRVANGGVQRSRAFGARRTVGVRAAGAGVRRGPPRARTCSKPGPCGSAGKPACGWFHTTSRNPAPAGSSRPRRAGSCRRVASTPCSAAAPRPRRSRRVRATHGAYISRSSASASYVVATRFAPVPSACASASANDRSPSPTSSTRSAAEHGSRAASPRGGRRREGGLAAPTSRWGARCGGVEVCGGVCGGGEVPLLACPSQRPSPRRCPGTRARAPPTRTPGVAGGGVGGGGGGREVTHVGGCCVPPPLPSFQLRLQPGAMLLGVLRCQALRVVSGGGTCCCGCLVQEEDRRPGRGLSDLYFVSAPDNIAILLPHQLLQLQPCC